MAEGICDREMERILAAFSQGSPGRRDTVELSGLARHALSAQITARFTGGRSEPAALRLDPGIESRFRSALERTLAGLDLMLEPQLTQEILTAVRREVGAIGPAGSGVPIPTHSELRPFVRKLVELEFPSLQVLSHQERLPGVHIQAIRDIRLDRAPRAVQSASLICNLRIAPSR